MPTGGVKPEYNNLKKWFDTGVHCVGMGSQLISKKLIKTGNYDELTINVRSALDMIIAIRQE